MRARIRQLLTLLVAGALLGGGLLAWAPQPASAAEQHCFDETGRCINPLFYDYWASHGGLAINGYPITDEIAQTLPDGKAYVVQYFERARFEYHPANGEGARILLGQFGRQLHPADPPVAQQPGATFFRETGHNVSGDFLAYWQANGGLAQFGYPLGEVQDETLPNAKGEPTSYRVQYFERARFEAHPENAAPYTVLLGQFGRAVYADTTGLNVVPCRADYLRADLVMQGAAGSREGTIHIVNPLNGPCSLAGAPQVRLLGGDGTPLAVTIAPPAAATASVGLAVAGRGEAINVPVRWSNYCGPAPGNVAIVLTLPDGGIVTVDRGISIPPCLGQGQPSTFSYQRFTNGPQGEAVANVLLGYFGAINKKDYRAAYDALGAALQAQQPYDTFAAGYATTLNDEASQIVVGASQAGRGYDVSLVLTAAQTDGSVRTYKGTYTLRPEGGPWKIVAADVRQQ